MDRDVSTLVNEVHHRIIRKEIVVAIWAVGLLAVCATVSVMGCCPLSDSSGDNRISQFSVQNYFGVFDEETNDITIDVPEDMDLSALVAEFTVPSGAVVTVGGVVQVSGVTANDFRFPVVYTVSSVSGPAVTYVVYVIASDVSTYAGSQSSEILPEFGAIVALLIIVVGATVYVRRAE